MKISMLPSGNVIYLRIDKKFIPIPYHKQKEEKTCTGKGSAKISKFKEFSTRVTTSTFHHDANNVLLINVGCSCIAVHLTSTKGGQV